jgi:3-isopropylmalate/(R)-2-methylmalate dehydratase large subunit
MPNGKEQAPMGMTVAEKLFTRKNTQEQPVKAGEFVDARIDGVMVSHRNLVKMDQHVKKSGKLGGLPRIWDLEKVYAMSDHFQPAPNADFAGWDKAQRLLAKRLNLKYFYDCEPGICHQMMCDYGHVRPGELIIGTDSHTVLYGALNAGGTGMGEADTSYALVFGELWFQVPPSIKVTLNGKVPNYPMAKDVILFLAGRYGDDFAQYKAIEYTGEAAQALSVDGRMCLADHVVEVGGKFGFFSCDQKTVNYVESKTSLPYEPIEADANAEYEREITVDVGQVGFQVAKPHRFRNVGPVSDAAGTKIDQAVIGACSNGRFEDIEVAARMLKGNKVSPDVRFIISPGSWTVYRQCLDAGLIPTLLDGGALFIQPGCSICQGLTGYLTDGDVCITAATRNYEGRLGSTKSEVYLSGPATVAAAAIAGRIVDSREVLSDL